jgi:hypothetical protein
MPTITHESLQGVLTDHLLRTTVDTLHRPNIDDIQFSTWISSCRNDFSGSWLEAIPTSPSYEFSNSDFRYAILFRLFLPLPLISPGDKCHCKLHPPLDPTSHHLSNGCNEDNIRNDNHTELKHEFASLLNYGGFAVIIEEQRCFASIVDTRKRPDICIQGWGLRGTTYKHRKLIIDVGITTQTLLGTQLGVLSSTLTLATHPDSQPSAHHNTKITKYQALANAAHLDFLPLIFASSGRPHSAAKGFISDLTIAISQFRNIPPTTLHLFIRKRLSCALQKALAGSFNKKIFLIHSKSNGPSTSAPEINDQAIMDSNYINYCDSATTFFDRFSDDGSV